MILVHKRTHDFPSDSRNSWRIFSISALMCVYGGNNHGFSPIFWWSGCIVINYKNQWLTTMRLVFLLSLSDLVRLRFNKTVFCNAIISAYIVLQIHNLLERSGGNRGIPTILVKILYNSVSNYLVKTNKINLFLFDPLSMALNNELESRFLLWAIIHESFCYNYSLHNNKHVKQKWSV